MPRGIRSLAAFLIAGGALAAAAWQGAGPAPESAGVLLAALRRPAPAYWKGNLHTHSFWSDGDDFPEMVADWYKRHGYHFLALSDHNVLADGERWLDLVGEKPNRRKALEKYQIRFGENWVERRTRMGREQVRLKPLAEFRSLLE